MQIRSEVEEEPFPKRQRIETKFSLENYPCDVIAEIVYHALRKDFKESFKNCRLISKTWTLGAETAAIQFANDGFNLKSACAKKWFSDLLSRRGHEFHVYKQESPKFVFPRDEYEIDKRAQESAMLAELQCMPNLKKITLNEDCDVLGEVLGLCPNISSYTSENASKKQLNSIAMKLPNLQMLEIDFYDRYKESAIGEGLLAIAKLSKLETLTISINDRTEIVESILEKSLCGGFCALKSLSLYSLYEGMSYYLGADIFLSLPNLEKLTLMGECKFDFEGALTSLPKLKYLKTENIHDSNLLKIGKSFPELEFLDISHSEVSDRGLTGFVYQRSKDIEIHIQGINIDRNWCLTLQELNPCVIFTV